MIEVKIPVFDVDQVWWNNFMGSLQASDWIGVGIDARKMRVDNALKGYHGRLIKWIDTEWCRVIGFESEEHYQWFLLRWS